MSGASTSTRPELSSVPSLKGKEKLIDLELETNDSSSDSSSDTSDDSESSSEYDSDSEEEITQEYLDALLEKARTNIKSTEVETIASTKTVWHDHFDDGEEDAIITLDNSEQQPIPTLNPGKLPPAYFELGATRNDASRILDPDAIRLERVTSSIVAPAPPVPPAELTKSGKPLTKKEKKELKKQTAGKDWFDLPAPAEADLPRLYREVESLRLRNQLDPKRFYRKEEGEGKGIKGLPKYFAIGTILPSSTPFGGSSSENISRSSRKRTLVDELVDDAEAKRYAKKKFGDLQTVRGAKGRKTLSSKKAMRRPKF